jgi:hypothetical protein
MLRVELRMKSTIGVQTAGIPCASYLIGDASTLFFKKDSQMSVRQPGFLQEYGRGRIVVD